MFNRNMTYYAYYDNVSGIQMSSPIIVQGIRVGAVTGIKFRPDLNNTVEVKFDVKSAYRVPDNSVVRLFTNGIMGKASKSSWAIRPMRFPTVRPYGRERRKAFWSWPVPSSIISNRSSTSSSVPSTADSRPQLDTRR